MKIKIKDLVGDLTYEEIKKRKWRHPRIWKNGEKILFINYIISKDGIIIRSKEGIKNHNGLGTLGKIIKPRKNFRGYLITNLTYDSSRLAGMMLHRILWETWKNKIPKNLQINHLDGNKKNNSLNNLEIVTSKENVRHAIRLGLSWSKKQRKKQSTRMKERLKDKRNHPRYGKKAKEETRKKMSKTKIGYKNPMYGKKGEDSPTAILSDLDIQRIIYFKHVLKIESLEIANKFKISRGWVNGILNGKNRNPNHFSKEELITNFKNKHLEFQNWENSIPFPVPPEGKRYKRPSIQKNRGKTIREICYTCKKIPCYICRRTKCPNWMKEESRKGQEKGCAYWEDGLCVEFSCELGIIKSHWKPERSINARKRKNPKHISKNTSKIRKKNSRKIKRKKHSSGE